MTGARRTTRARPSLGRLWGMRFLVVTAVGLAVGAAAGIIGVNTLEPGRASEPDSLQVMLDSMSKGTTKDKAVPKTESRSPVPAAMAPAEVAPAAAAPAEIAAPSSDPTAELLAVPDVVGMEEGAARIRITATGFTVGSVEFRPSRTPLGTVIAIAPAARSLVQRGTAIALILSSGRSP